VRGHKKIIGKQETEINVPELITFGPPDPDLLLFASDPNPFNGFKLNLPNALQ
jgi:hypothetical protein